MKAIDFIIENWSIITPVIYTLAARLIPTKKNWDIVEFVLKFLDKTIPNLKKDSLGNIKK